MFSLDRQRYADGLLAVSMLEPGTGEALETPCTAESFHESELIDYRDFSAFDTHLGKVGRNCKHIPHPEGLR